MTIQSFGIQELTDEDRGYNGSLFSQVRNAIFANPYEKVWGSAGESAIPIYKVTLANLIGKALFFNRNSPLQKAADRTVDSNADLRWGEDGKGFHRLLHTNGVCLTGLWEITEDTPYSGYFKNGSQALIIARYSTCCTECRRGHTRSLALVGKLYPTTDKDHKTPLKTAQIFTQQDIGGENSTCINAAELRNAPNTTILRRGTGAPILAVTGLALMRADKEPANRQLYEIAELRRDEGEKTVSPEFMRLLVAPEQPRIAGEALDFRDEIMAQIYDKGDATPKRKLVFNIEVSDEGRTQGPSAMQKRHISNWRHIGRITFDEAVISYNGDFVIHFHHPTWRDDRNDPKTATRINGQKVRQ